MNKITVHGACTHNLKNIDLIIPHNKLIVVTGLSGSGKSSLIFNTLCAEGQSRYAESLPSYMRQFLSFTEKPDVDYIEGLLPIISIEQKSISNNPRSTVGTITEIDDYLRLLFSNIGEPRCPEHDIPLAAQTISQMVDNVMAQSKGKRLALLAPIAKERKGEYPSKVLETLISQGYVHVRIDGKIYDLSVSPNLEIQKQHTIEVVIDRFKIRKNMETRLAESFEIALELSGGTAVVANVDNPEEKELLFSDNFACPICNCSMRKLEPSLFSFNNPKGACKTCNGLGIQQYFDPDLVIQNPKLSLADGAISSWDQHNFHYFQTLKSLAEYYKFDIQAPWINLSTDVRKMILFGSNQVNIDFKYVSDRDNSTFVPYPSFEGVLSNIERRYRETKSSSVRKKLAKFINIRSCTICKGTRLCREARHIFVENTSLPTILEMSIDHAMDFFANLKLSDQRVKIAKKVLKEIRDRLKFLIDVGLSYLTLSRSTGTLSSGEANRIRLARHIGANLVGLIYVLDEPSIGLHQRDNKRLLNTLAYLRNLGNTVIVVEHDENTIRAADHVIDIGPGAGVHGGRVVAEGSLDTVIEIPESLTGQYISGKRKIEVPKQRVSADPKKALKLSGAHGNNLKDITLTLPVGLFTCITGVSGSGKSTLINNTLFPLAQIQLNGATRIEPAPYLSIQGLEYFDKVISIDQSPIYHTSRSNLATYTGIFTLVRKLFAGVPESRLRGYTPGRFSFNMRGGRCEACRGNGVIKVEMHFLSDTYASCDQCKGKRYNRETLEIKYKGKMIYEVLSMTIEEAYDFFDAVPILAGKLKTLMNVGLTYIKLEQLITTFSSGEAQRVKLARALSKPGNGRTLYILDEPTIGLHFADIQQLLNVLYQLRDQGNTIVVVEHNLDIIKTADWIIDLGPEGGDKGGEILVSGTPETVVGCEVSHTSHFLKPLL